MLAGQQLGRGHDDGLLLVFRREKSAGRGDEGLAAADVALQQPVHPPAGAQVGVGLRDGAALRARRGKGQGRKELLRVARGEGLPRLPLLARAQKLQRAAEGEQLLKDQPPPRLPDVLRRLGIVDALIGPFRRREPVFLDELGRQRLAILPARRVKGLPRHAHQQVL